MTEKQYKNCLVEGSFNPPHMGHINMIGYALTLSESVYVHVGTDPSVDLLSYDEKKALIYINVLRNFSPESANRIVFVQNFDEEYSVMITDEHGTVINESYWTTYLNKIHMKMQSGVIGPLDCIVSSDLYGARIGKELNIDWIMYDPDRSITPISSTKLRKAYDRFTSGTITPWIWDYSLPELTYKFCRVFVVNGTEGSGKSTLAYGIKGLYTRSEVVSEYGRPYTVEKLKANSDHKFTIQDFKNIVIGHQFSIDVARSRTKTGIVVVDTDALTTFLFAKYYLSNEDRLEFEKWCIPFVEQQLGMSDLYLITSKLLFNDDDNSRTLTEDQRKEFWDRMISLLEEYKMNYIILPNGNSAGVLNKAYAYVKNHLASNQLQRKLGV